MQGRPLPVAASAFPTRSCRERDARFAKVAGHRRSLSRFDRNRAAARRGHRSRGLRDPDSLGFQPCVALPEGGRPTGSSHDRGARARPRPAHLMSASATTPAMSAAARSATPARPSARARLAVRSSPSDSAACAARLARRLIGSTALHAGHSSPTTTLLGALRVRRPRGDGRSAGRVGEDVVRSTPTGRGGGGARAGLARAIVSSVPYRSRGRDASRACWAEPCGGAPRARAFAPATRATPRYLTLVGLSRSDYGLNRRRMRGAARGRAHLSESLPGGALFALPALGALQFSASTRCRAAYDVARARSHGKA